MFINLDGQKIYYETAGAGRPVLLLHGWGTDSQSMRPILDCLKNTQQYQVYALDFPGFGFSDPPPTAWQVSDFGAVVLKLLDKLNLAKVDLVAHSFGGRVTIKLAAEYPERVRRVVLIGSAGIRPERTASYYLKVYFAKASRVILGLLPESVGRVIKTKLLDKLGSKDYQQATAEMRGTFVKVVNEDLRHLLPTIHAPVLLVWGELDTETPLRDALLMKQLLPNARLEVLPKAGHYCYLEDLAIFSKILLSFLDEK